MKSLREELSLSQRNVPIKPAVFIKPRVETKKVTEFALEWLAVVEAEKLRAEGISAQLSICTFVIDNVESS